MIVAPPGTSGLAKVMLPAVGGRALGAASVAGEHSDTEHAPTLCLVHVRLDAGAASVKVAESVCLAPVEYMYCTST
jgi:hypothetical protein